MRSPIAVLRARVAARRSRRASPTGSAFDAFISYSHAVDGELAKALQNSLHRFAKPWYRLRALRVFRDEASLATDPDLWGSIREALLGARHLILLASPEAARSQWVAREVQTWTERHGAERLLLVLTGGALAWKHDGSVDWTATDALPRASEDAFAGEPRYLDLRWIPSGSAPSLRDARFREAVADLAAPLHGRPKDALIGDDVREHRRARRLARGAVAVISALAVLASAAAVVALDQRNEAKHQLAVATSRYLASQAKAAVGDQRAQGLLLSLEALRARDTPEARDALLTTLLQTPNLRMLLQPRNGGPQTVAVSSDGKLLAAGTTAGTVELWDWAKGRPRGVLGEPGPDITEVEFAPGAPELVAATVDGRLHRWDLRTGRPAARPITVRRDGGLVVFAFHPGGRRVVTGDIDGDLRIWNFGSGRPASPPVPAHPGGVTGIAFTASGRALASAGQDGFVRRWTPGLERPVGAPVRVTRSAVWGLAAPAFGSFFTAAIQDGTVGFLGTGEPAFRTLGRHRGQGTSVSVDPNGQLIASGGFDNAIRLWNPTSAQAVGGALRGHIAFVSDVAVAPAGRGVASAGADGVVAVWDLQRSFPLVRELPGLRSDAGSAMAWGPDGRTLFTVDRGVTRWDARTGESSPVVDPRRRVEVTALDVSPDGTTLAIGTASGPALDKTGAVELWNLDGARTEHETLPLPVDQPFWPYTIRFSPDGDSLVAGGLDRILLWRLDERREPLVMKGSVAAFSRDGATLAITTGAPDQGIVRLWDARTGRPRPGALRTGRASFVNDVTFSPDGTTVAAADRDGTVVLWDAESRRRIGEPLTGFRTTVNSVRFSPDGRTLAAASGSSAELRLWQLPARQPLGPPLRGDGIAFSPDGAVLAARTPDGTVALWSFDVASWRRHACALAGRNLGPAEWTQFMGELGDYEPACPGLRRGRPVTPAVSAD